MAGEGRREDALHRARIAIGECYCESFNGALRDELLNGEIFYSLTEARIPIEAWRRHYNTVRPHSSLGYRPPTPEAIPSPVSPSGSASFHLRPTLAIEASMH